MQNYKDRILSNVGENRSISALINKRKNNYFFICHEFSTYCDVLLEGGIKASVNFLYSVVNRTSLVMFVPNPMRAP